MPEIETVEMHTGGEPVRIVTAGFVVPAGGTILAKRRWAAEHAEELRRLLMWEPRGHADMYGVLPVEPDLPDADLAVLFMHNAGWSTMCGHAVIALGRFAVEQGLVPVREPLTPVRIQCPCGLVEALVEVEGGKSGAVRFRSVPAFAHGLDRVLEVEGVGPVLVDVGYGGAFYAVIDAGQFGLDVGRSPVGELVELAHRVTTAGRAQLELHHPDDPDLAFLYGTILTDGGSGEHEPSANVCVFAEREVDRSPTGSGVTARMALMHRRRQVAAGSIRRFASRTGAVFTGQVVGEERLDGRPAVRVEVRGRAHFTGAARFTLEEDDAIGRGFLL
ncbi:proline racemase family protein [Geminicoccus harenae]|uniref:proline racemase family protein n=1 Tax=Geminicoccus harenae TaxID=2498453 RepID=UPI001CC2BD22|nr:proline racemase family protein [Geminicoccus harenae]